MCSQARADPGEAAGENEGEGEADNDDELSSLSEDEGVASPNDGAKRRRVRGTRVSSVEPSSKGREEHRTRKGQRNADEDGHRIVCIGSMDKRPSIQEPQTVLSFFNALRAIL